MPHSSTHSTLRAVIFDMDGVLVSSDTVHWEAYRRTFAAVDPSYRERFTHEEYLKVALGAAREVVLRRVLGDIAPEDLQPLMAAKERHVIDVLREQGVETIPGATQFVAAVRRRGLKTAVATASRNPDLFLAAASLANAFDAVIDRTQVEHPKPFPDLYQHAAQTLGIPPSRCLAIEDSPTGIESALACGMPVIALSTTHSPKQLERAKAVYASFAEIRPEEWLK